MVGVVAHTDVSIVTGKLGRLNQAELDWLLYEVSVLVEDQTKLRIANEKTAPDGTPWAPWSDRYAATRNTGNRRRHSLLVGEGDLRDSIQAYTMGMGSSSMAAVGSPLIYAATHQFGDEARGIPARPYLGISADNHSDIEHFVARRIQDLLK